MKTARLFLVCISTVLTACSSAPPPAAKTPPPANAAAAAAPSVSAEQPKPEPIATDSPRTTAAGHTFTVPAGWTLYRNGAARVLEGPEKDVKVALVDVARAADAADAVKQAWPALDPKFSRPLHIVQDVPGRFGWETPKVFEYETSPNEKRDVMAVARKKGDAWCVTLVDGSNAAMGRRGSQVNLVAGSLRPAGYTRESFAGKTAHPLDAARVKLLTEFIENARKAADVPGVAIGLVDHGKVVIAGGFGVRELGKPAKVDGDSLFIIASNTKALSTLLLAKEVDRGKFGWDTPVTQV
ncbi:MAG TPA: serine hydrolase domain-containing protein, partial [Polyangia bacterium]|nr:serine hydrolase domain-containing protein [Polyangia bacterium]